MAQTSYPFDSTNTSEAQFSQLFRRLNFTGIAGTPGDGNVKVSANSSGMQVTVSSGYAMVRGHFCKNSADVTLTIDAASSSPRRDLIVLKLDPTTANSITLAVKKGTAAASPSDPSLTQSDEDVYELPIARVNVAANATTVSAGNVDDLRTFMGAPVGRWTTPLLPASPEKHGLGKRARLPSGMARLGWRLLLARLRRLLSQRRSKLTSSSERFVQAATRTLPASVSLLDRLLLLELRPATSGSTRRRFKWLTLVPSLDALTMSSICRSGSPVLTGVVTTLRSPGVLSHAFARLTAVATITTDRRRIPLT